MTAEEAAKAGFRLEDYDTDPVEVWPENHAVWLLFVRLGTQWRRAGMAGVATGLDYGPLMGLLDRKAADPQQWDEWFHDVQVMEAAALAVMNEKHD